MTEGTAEKLTQSAEEELRTIFNEIARLRELMRRDQEEIDRLKVESRAIAKENERLMNELEAALR